MFTNLVASYEITTDLYQYGFDCDRTQFVWVTDAENKEILLERKAGEEHLEAHPDSLFIPAYTANELCMYLAGLCALSYERDPEGAIFLAFPVTHESLNITEDLANLVLQCFTGDKGPQIAELKYDAIKLINNEKAFVLGVNINYSTTAHREMFDTILNYLDRQCPTRKSGELTPVGDYQVDTSLLEDGRLVCSIKNPGNPKKVCQCVKEPSGVVRLLMGSDLVLRDVAKAIIDLKESDLLN